jgi:hypothetical protein
MVAMRPARRGVGSRRTNFSVGRKSSRDETPTNLISYDTQQFYNAALATFAGFVGAALSFRVLPPLAFYSQDHLQVEIGKPPGGPPNCDTQRSMRRQ